MDDREKKSNWDDLARELGADAPPEATIPPQPTQAAHEAPPRKKPVEPPPRPKPNPQGWDNLAADFGLEVPPPPPPPPPSPPPLPPPPKLAPPAPTRAVVESRPPREEVSKRREERPPRRQRPPRRDERGQREDRTARPPRPPREEHPRPEPSREPQPEPEPEVTPAPGLGVSLWHKIFGSPDQQAERIAESVRSAETEQHRDRAESREEPPREDRHDHRGRRDQEIHVERAEVDEMEVDVAWREESADVSDADTVHSVEGARPPDDEDGEPRRRRRRRGRGRGRWRRAEGEQAGDERAADQAETRSGDADQPREPREPRSRGRRDRGRPRRDESRKYEDAKDDLDGGLDEIVLDDEDDEIGVEGDAEDSAEAVERGAPAGHKSIPSWDEAIGMIVDTNLSTRTERRRSSPPSRGSGSSRGRSRGGRKRKS